MFLLVVIAVYRLKSLRQNYIIYTLYIRSVAIKTTALGAYAYVFR